MGNDWVEVALLAGSVRVVLIVERLDSVLEAVVDTGGSAWNLHAKDMGSAVVQLARVLAAAIWLAALWQRSC